MKKDNQKIEDIDFTNEAIKSAVNGEINQHPFTVFSGIATLSSVLYMSLFGPTGALLGLSLGSFLLTSGSYVVNKFFRGESFEKRYVDKLRRQIQKNTEIAIDNLKRELKMFNCPEGYAQIDELKEKFESLVSVLEKKLKPGGLAFNRFLGMAEQVYKNGLDNLQQVVANLDSISPIDVKSLQRRIEDLHRKMSGNAIAMEEINSIKETLKKREERLQEVDDLLRQNVLAMNRLDQTAMDISTMEASEERATTDMEAAMSELAHLAKQFKGFKTE